MEGEREGVLAEMEREGKGRKGEREGVLAEMEREGERMDGWMHGGRGKGTRKVLYLAPVGRGGKINSYGRGGGEQYVA